MPYPPPKPLLTFLKPYPPEVRELALAVRDFVIPFMQPCHEYIYDAYSAVSFGYGPNDRYQDGAIHVAVYSGHVNIGFNQGAHMKDPAKLLHGTGKNVRHITIKSEEYLSHPVLPQYLKEARRIAAQANAYPADLKGVVSVVKAIYANKRRPDRQPEKKRTTRTKR